VVTLSLSVGEQLPRLALDAPHFLKQAELLLELLGQGVYTCSVASSALSVALGPNDERDSRNDSSVLLQPSVDVAGVPSNRSKRPRTFKKKARLTKWIHC